MKQTPYYFLLPSILILAFTSLYPICYSVYYSLFNWRWGDEKDFIGLNNYIVLLSDKEFWIIVKNTFVFAFFACFFEILIGVLLAIYIDRIKNWIYNNTYRFVNSLNGIRNICNNAL